MYIPAQKHVHLGTPTPHIQQTPASDLLLSDDFIDYYLRR